ncbi:MAP7 domain-containing protein [Legionella sp. km772]|uniref:MAP7 domain-containing protein n=1 Tax=Legionella sp. km772 TaxID=2498111 RepID=UPI000F8CC676|nr:MAP7 domain-containing protein [Legionella sp. km772]RUR12057.1 hypothetical protein ELY15_06330 [Legionella sp. km772]
MPGLIEKVNESLDVSGAFDNCFFHTYATHLLANKQALPEDLFTFTSIIGPHSAASKLQQKFATDPTLTLFEKQHRYSHPEEESPSFIVEKTLVLGFLLREWFATHMTQNIEIAEQMQAKVIVGFNEYINFRGWGTEKELLTSGEQGVLFQANEAFLEYAVLRNSETFAEKDKKPQFEKYFIGVDKDTALKNYWLAEGYTNYCQSMAKPNTKLSHADVAHVLEHLEQPITIFDQTAPKQLLERRISKLLDAYTNARVAGSSQEMLLSGEKKALYLATQDFLEYVVLRKSENFKQEDTLPEFEKYFTDKNKAFNKADFIQAFKMYWSAEGLTNYNQYISLPSTAATNIDEDLFIIGEEEEGAIIYRNEGSAETHPKMEVALNVREGHYKLLRTENTTALLDDYESSFKQYKIDREAILAHVGDKNSFAQKQPSIFAAAICPTGHLNTAPFDLLLNKIDEHQGFVKATEKEIEKARIEEQQRALEAEQVLELQKKLEEEQARALEAQKKLEEEQARTLEAQKKLEEEQARELEVQRKLEEEQASIDKPSPIVDQVDEVVDIVALDKKPKKNVKPKTGIDKENIPPQVNNVVHETQPQIKVNATKPKKKTVVEKHDLHEEARIEPIVHNLQPKKVKVPKAKKKPVVENHGDAIEVVIHPPIQQVEAIDKEQVHLKKEEPQVDDLHEEEILATHNVQAPIHEHPEVIHNDPVIVPPKEIKPEPKKEVFPEINNIIYKRSEFNKRMQELATQVESLKGRRYKEPVNSEDYQKLDAAYNKANKVHDILDKNGKKYFNKEISYAEFKRNADEAVQDARPVLENHRGAKEALEVILNVVLFLAVLARSAWNGKMTFFKVDTESVKKVDAVVESVNKAAPGA